MLTLFLKIWKGSLYCCLDFHNITHIQAGMKFRYLTNADFKLIISLNLTFVTSNINVLLLTSGEFNNKRYELLQALLPRGSRSRATPLTEVVRKMLRHERSLQALMDADFERHLMRFENFRYRFGNPNDFFSTSLCDLHNSDRYKPNPDGFTDLYVWVGHSGITQPYQASHPLLKIDDNDSLAEQSSSIFEFSVVIRIN